MRAFCAKVSGSVVEASSFLSSDVTSTVGGGVKVAEAPNGFALADEAKGFAGAVPFEFEEKGFEKGFAGAVELVLFFTPKSDSPILGCGFSSSCLISFFSGFLFDAPFAIRTPRMPLTLPSFLLHAFLRQLQMYSLRSWPGKWSGRSPLSSSRRLRRPLHTLHLARAPEGAVLSSIQF